MKIIHMEDDVLKQSAISRAIRGVGNVEIDWVKDMESGLEKIQEAADKGMPYDLAITDMQYPLSKNEDINPEAGEIFMKKIKDLDINLPIIVCSSINMQYADAHGCVWYNDSHNWERDMVSLVKKIS